MNNDTDGWVVTHIPCEKCGSSDGASVSQTGWTKCFACGDNSPSAYHENSTEQPRRAKKISLDLIDDVSFSGGIPARGIDEATCRKFAYGRGTYQGQPVHIANEYDRAGSVVAQKIRRKDKSFSWLGDQKAAEPLYGMHLWRDRGKMVVITEGEIDTLTVSMLQDNQWPVVSLPNGAQAAKKALADAGDWLEGFEKVVLMFDQDEPGREATEAAASVLPPGKAWVAVLPRKDANECLQEGLRKEVIQAIWNARQWRPDSVIEGKDLWERMTTHTGFEGLEMPFPELGKMVPKLVLGATYVLLAGTGSGKTTFCRALEHAAIKAGENVGILHLEEDTLETGLGIVGYELGIQAQEGKRPGNSEDFRRAYDDTVGRDGVFLYDNFGSIDPDVVIPKIRYMATSGGCKYIFLDHISIMLSGLSAANGTKELDRVMTALVTLAKELKICLIVVSHLTKSSGDPFEEGGKISLQNARGSQSIAQLSFVTLALERNQQAKNPQDRDTILVRVLKNRLFRKLGPACSLLYNHTTGRLIDMPLAWGGAEDEFDEDLSEEDHIPSNTDTEKDHRTTHSAYEDDDIPF